MVNDSIADMLTRIRNAQTAKHESVTLETSKMKKSIAQILLDEGYISSFEEVENGKFTNLVINLKYVNKNKVITGLLIKFQSQAFFQNRDDQTHTVVINAVGGTPGSREGSWRNQRLNFRDQRTGTFQRTNRAVSRNVFQTSCQEHFRRIFHLNQALVTHFKHADLVGGAVAVLDGADDAVGLLAFPFKIQHRVHHMLQHLRSRDTAFFVHVSHHDHGSTFALCLVDKGKGSFFYLGNASGGGVDRSRINCLNGINDQHVGLDLVGFLNDLFNVGFGEDKEIGANNAQALGAELQLTARFLT